MAGLAETQPLTDALARSFGVNKKAGVLISGVYRKDQRKADIFPGDILTHECQKVADGRAAMNQVADLEPGRRYPSACCETANQ